MHLSYVPTPTESCIGSNETRRSPRPSREGWGESPTFQSCIQGHEESNKEDATEKNPSTFGGTVTTYGHCTGEFIEKHDGALTAFGTLIIAAFTGTLWVATSRQAHHTEGNCADGECA